NLHVSSPSLIYPNTTYTLAWNGSAHATSYQLKPGGGLVQSGITGTHKSETAPGTGNTDVYWRVRACGAGGCSAWSSALDVFITAHTGGGGGGPQCPPICVNPRLRAPGGGGVHTLTTGSQPGSGAGALTVQTTYNGQGYPVSLKRTSDGYTYVTITAMDPYGHATVLNEGNGVTVTRGYDQATGLILSTD